MHHEEPQIGGSPPKDVISAYVISGAITMSVDASDARSPAHANLVPETAIQGRKVYFQTQKKGGQPNSLARGTSRFKLATGVTAHSQVDSN